MGSYRSRIEIERSSDLLDRLIVPRLRRQVRRVVQPGRRQRGIEIERAQQRPFSSRPVPIPHEMHVSQRRVRVRERLVQTERGLGGLLCLRHGFPRVEIETRQPRVGFSQASVGPRVGRILGHRGVEILDRRSQAVLGGFGGVVTTQQYLPVSLRIERPCGSDSRLLLWGQRDIDFARDRSRHLTMEGHDVLQVTLERLGPHDGARGSADQFRRDSNPTACPKHGPFDNRVDLQLPRDGGRGLRGRSGTP